MVNRSHGVERLTVEDGSIEPVKAELVVKYRRLSDTAIGWVSSVVPEPGDFDLHADSHRENLDADTSVEWKTVDGRDFAIGFQVMHASVGGRVTSLPWIVNEIIHELVEAERSTPRPDDPRLMLKATERVASVDFAALVRPPSVVAKQSVPLHAAKGVEASLSELIARLEKTLSPDEKNEPGLPALRDLLSSISGGQGLSSERTAEATLDALLRSNWSNRSAWKQARLVTSQLRFQPSWPEAIQSALMSHDDVDAIDDDSVDEEA